MEQLQITRLTGDNYEIWKMRYIAVLESKDIDHVLSQDYSLETSAEYGNFKKADKLAKAILVQALPDDLALLIRGVKSAKEAFEIVKSRFERTGLIEKMQIRRELQNLKYYFNDDLKEFMLKFENYITKVQSMGSIMTDSDIIAQLLISMPPEFNSGVTAIETITAKDEMRL